MLREVISRCKTIKHCADNFTQDFGLDLEERIIAEYYSTFWDLLTFLLKVDDIGFRKLLSRLKPCLLNDAEMISMLGVFKALIVKAISKNDVRLLTELCYSVQNLADYSDKNNPSKIKREVADLNPYGIGMTEHITQMAFCSNSHYKGIALYVLLQAALKSIELGHYETTGFLIKYMVSNFDYNLIKRTFDKLLKVNGIDDEYLNKGELFDRINVSFNINDKTSKYCLQKLTILLYLQQNFYNEYICDDLANKEQHINICILTNCKIVDYLFSKILLAGNKYGLLCLNNEEFYKRTKAELVKRITSMQQSMDKLKRNFEQHNMAVFQVSNSQELLDLLNEFIKDNTTVGCGDSVTLEQTGVFDYLRKRDITFLDKYQPSLSHEDKRAIYLRNFTADNFITGSNAITMDGKIFNIDGNGSRVAPMIYGPEQVIIVVGTNKITENVDEAIKRVRQIAAPLDAKRLGKGTPCTKLGCCIDCSHKERICNDFVLIANQFVKDRIKIIIIDQGLGY